MVSEALLKNYHLLNSSDDIDTRDLLMDLHAAINTAGLDSIERAVIDATYLSGPIIPIRNGKPGRPKMAGVQGAIAVSLSEQLKTGLLRRRVSNQTEYHGLHRSIKQYKKVLNRALLKIEQSLGYGESTVELSSASLRHLPRKYITQV